MYKANDINVNDLNLKAYSDADFAGDRDQRKSTTGCITKLSNSPVIWLSKRQSCVALSTAEAEYVAASQAARELIWARNFLQDLGFECNKPSILYIDNTTAVSWTKDHVLNNKNKHIEVKYHYVRYKVESKEINPVYVPTELQHADLFTKNFNKNIFLQLLNFIGMQ